MKFLGTLAGKIIAGAAVLILLLGFLYVRSCQQANQRAAQSRIDRSQAGAARESAADAINTVSGVSENQAASEGLTRSNRDEILKAEGASDRVNPAVRDAGLRALCRRKAAANDPRCGVQPAPAR
ncbi:MAG TPA: hypothetical protein VFS91_00060 [Nitrobacter sp.]|nr:hypothetical protein [Nitrobacter sp.]